MKPEKQHSSRWHRSELWHEILQWHQHNFLAIVRRLDISLRLTSSFSDDLHDYVGQISPLLKSATLLEELNIQAIKQRVTESVSRIQCICISTTTSLDQRLLLSYIPFLGTKNSRGNGFKTSEARKMLPIAYSLAQRSGNNPSNSSFHPSFPRRYSYKIS